MKRIGMAIVLFLMMIGTSSTQAEGSVQEVRATWLWNPWMIVSDEVGTIDFIESKKVNKVYVQIDSDIPKDVYRSFIEKASEKGISIYALDGSAEWVAPKGYTSQNKLMTWLANYQNSSNANQQFSGVHLDIEPYLYSGWVSNQAATVKSYQSLLSRAKNSTDTLNIPLEADIPFWFDEISYKNSYGKGILAEWVIAKTNSVTIMAYRDSAPMIIDIVKNEIALAAKYGKSIVIGVETGETNEGDMITFYEEGESYMNQQLTVVKEYYAGVSGFNGTAIHHVGSWMTMKP